MRTGLFLRLGALGLLASVAGTAPAQAAGNVYTVAKYPIEAEADDAVAAKSAAMADGQAGAFRALLKRLVPVTAYRYLPKPNLKDIEALTDGFNIRSEQNSSTEYLATLDFHYNADAVRSFMQRERLPYLERQAPETVIVPIYRNRNEAAPRYLATASGQRSWREAWSGLDLKNALTPVKLASYKLEIRDDVLQRLISGDMTDIRIFQEEFSATRIIIAHATPGPDSKKLEITLAGHDAVGRFHLKKSYTIEDEDFLYTAELATIVGLGILEGRWKAVAQPSSGVSVAAGPVEAIRFFVSFNGLGEWQRIRARIAGLPGVSDMNTGTVSARGAEVSMHYPGGMVALQQRVAAEGMYFTNSGGDWVLQQN
ncbi:MAG: DUF2066 domain-containing protein [Hyphomicrobiaceae bacterium]